MTTSWFTSIAPDDKCDFHNHCHCMYRGVLYIKAAKNSSNIVFDPHENYRFDLKVKDFNINNSHIWWIPPEKGKIIFLGSHYSVVAPDQSLFTNNKGKQIFLKGKVSDEKVYVLSNQSSAKLSSFSICDTLICIPENSNKILKNQNLLLFI